MIDRKAVEARAVTAYQRSWLRRVVVDLVIGIMLPRESWRSRALNAEQEVPRLKAARLARDTEPCTVLPDAEEGGLES